MTSHKLDTAEDARNELKEAIRKGKKKELKEIVERLDALVSRESTRKNQLMLKVQILLELYLHLVQPVKAQDRNMVLMWVIIKGTWYRRARVIKNS